MISKWFQQMFITLLQLRLIQLWPFISYNWLFLWDKKHSILMGFSYSTYNWYNSGLNCMGYNERTRSWTPAKFHRLFDVARCLKMVGLTRNHGYWLVLWNMAFIFPYIENHHPTDFHIFQRGRYTTNQEILIGTSGASPMDWTGVV